MRGERPNVHLQIGDRAWEYARFRRPPETLVYPVNEEIEAFDWRICRGLAVTLLVRGPYFDVGDRLARELVRSGAELVALLCRVAEGEAVTSVYYRPSAR